MSVVINTQKADRVFCSLYDAYSERRQLYEFVRAENSAPQWKHFPKSLPRDASSLMYLRWLAVATGTDRRAVSERVYAGHARLYDAYPHMYDTDGIARMYPGEVRQLYARNSVGMPTQSASYSQTVLQSLRMFFNNNPATIYRESIDETQKDLRYLQRESGRSPLPGFGPKILSLYAIFLEELGLVSMPDAVPVDVWVQGIMLATGGVEVQGSASNEHMEQILRPYLAELCARRGWSRVTLSHAVWFNGNRNCRMCDRRNLAHSCPVYDSCSGRISSEGYFKAGKWDSQGLVPKTPQLGLFSNQMY